MSRAGVTTRRGRQAEARRNDRAVLDAARVVFATHGPQAPVSAVAAAAGIGIGGLYRRFPSKAQLLAHLCHASLDQQVDAAERALRAGPDPWQALAAYITECVSFRAGALSSLAGEVPVTPEMSATARRSHLLLDELVGRARAAGALRQDIGGTDVQSLITLFSRRPPGADVAHDRLLAIALDGLRSTDGGRLDEPLSWAAHADRWRSAACTPVGELRHVQSARPASCQTRRHDRFDSATASLAQPAGP